MKGGVLYIGYFGIIKSMEQLTKTNLGSKENKETTIPKLEVLKMPEIVIQEEPGIQLFSLLLKAENPKWGEQETEIAKETKEYFEKTPIDSDILKRIKNLQEDGVDEESFYNIALAYKHPERIEGILKKANRYKPNIKDPQDACDKFLLVLDSFNESFSTSPLAEKIKREIELDKEKRLENIEDTKKRIEKLINFFKPDSKTTDIKKISFIPTDPLYDKYSGRAFSAFSGEHIIKSHIDNVDNMDHEFCHGIINPIVDKLSKVLTSEQKEKISSLASYKLKQDYGDYFYSLLCEELIRTYNNVIKKVKTPETYEDFKQKIPEFDEKFFQKEILSNKDFGERCESLGIKSIKEFDDKSKEYFEKFEKNELREIIFELYHEYMDSSSEENDNFEKFLLSNLPNRI